MKLIITNEDISEFDHLEAKLERSVGRLEEMYA